NASLTLQPNVKDQNLNAEITDYSFKLSLEKSAIGPLFPSVLNTVINGVLSFIVIPKLNVIAAKGVPLPMVGDVQFSNTMLLLQEGNLLIGTDLQYKGIPIRSSKCKQLTEGYTCFENDDEDEYSKYYVESALGDHLM
ncbi:hypothetical protein EGW08_000194, partial [Elysia chlorotica]